MQLIFGSERPNPKRRGRGLLSLGLSAVLIFDACSSGSGLVAYEEGFAVLMGRFESAERTSAKYLESFEKLAGGVHLSPERQIFTFLTSQLLSEDAATYAELDGLINDLRSDSLSGFVQSEELESIRSAMLNHYYTWQDFISKRDAPWRHLLELVQAGEYITREEVISEFEQNMQITQPIEEEISSTWRNLCELLGRLQPSEDDRYNFNSRIRNECLN